MRIDPTKPIEIPVGENAAALRHFVGNRHVGEHPLTVIRAIWRKITPETRAKMPRALKRGVFQFIIETHLGNRQLYVDVMRGTV